MKRYIKSAAIPDKWEKGTEVYVEWFWPEGEGPTTEGYALCEYVGKTRDGKHKFESTTYGWIYLVDLKNNEVISPEGEHYELNNRSGWATNRV